MVKLLMVPLVIACYLLYAVENTYTAENGKSEYRAWLEIEADNSHLEIKAYCRNNSSENSVLKYELKAQKKGRAGKTASSQSGPVYLRSQEEKCLSRLGLRVSPKDVYEIKLEVYEDGKLVAEDSVFYPPGLRI